MKKVKLNLYFEIKKAYLKKVIIPLIFFQFLLFIFLIFFNRFYRKIGTENLYKENIIRIDNILKFEKNKIENNFTEIENLTKLYGKETFSALYFLKCNDSKILERMKYGEKGVFYTFENSKEDGVGVFYSGYYPIGEKERTKVTLLSRLESMMKSIVKDNYLISSIYFNSFDSLNVIYPYFDVISQYPINMDIPQYNFYYEADNKNNPEKDIVWTGSYLDPAGHGWMISSIYPVYNKEFLEGVVGLDVTLETIIEDVLNVDVPWQGYIMIVDDMGTILAIPNQGEEDFGIKELKNHKYDDSIKKDTFKPDDFNIMKNSLFKNLSSVLAKNKIGHEEIKIMGKNKLINWDSIENTSWKLVIVTDKKSLLKEIQEVSSYFYKIGASILFVFIIFQIIIFRFLNNSVKSIVEVISYPLSKIRQAIVNIGNENFTDKVENSDILEIDETIFNLNEMSLKLEKNIVERKNAQEKLFEYQSSLEEIIEDRTENLKKINKELKELQSQIIQRERLASIGLLAAGISHEINNPIGFINSNMFSLRKYYEEIKLYIDFLENSFPESFKKNIIEYRELNQIDFILEDSLDIFYDSIEGIKRIIKIIKSLKSFSNIDEEDRVDDFDINNSIKNTLNILRAEYKDFVEIETKLNSTNLIHCFSGEINQVILNLLSNSVYFVKEKWKIANGTIEIITENSGEGIEFTIIDNGVGISSEVKEKIFNPFFTTKPQGSGTGLGLHISYDIIVNKHGGTFCFDSDGEKTWFKFYLPKYFINR